MAHLIHITRNGFRTNCGQTAGLNCVGPEDWECSNCAGCDEITLAGPAVDMSAAMRAELPAQ